MAGGSLVIRPAGRGTAAGDRLDAALRVLCPEGFDEFVCGEGMRTEFRNRVAAGGYAKIVLDAPRTGSASGAPDIETVVSLLPGATVILYHPDLSLLRRGEHADTDGAPAEGWMAGGGTFQADACRLADVVIVEDDETLNALTSAGGSMPPVITDAGLAAGADIAKRRHGKVSIVMLTFNQRDLTAACVDSLRRHTPGDYELIFVDNGSRDGTREYLESLRESSGRVQVVYNPSNAGFSRANNQGIRLASGEYVLLLNNDVIVTEGWLERMLACLVRDPQTGMVGPCTNKAVGRQVVHTELAPDDREIQLFAAMHALRNAGRRFEAHRIIGFCMLVRREVLQGVGLLDERFGPGGFEDYDYCLRVRQAGYRIMIAGDAFVYHVGGQGYTQNNMDYDALRRRNIQIFIDKWCRRSLEILETLPDGM